MFGYPIGDGLPGDPVAIENLNVSQTTLCETALLVQNHVLQVLPDTQSAPWWRFNMKGVGNFLIIRYGSWELGHPKNTRAWRADGVRHVARTYTAFLKGDDDVRPLKRFGPFTVRVSYVDDPAAGAWKAEAVEYIKPSVGTGETDPIRQSIRDKITSEACPVQQFGAARENAKRQAYDQAEQQIGQTTGLVRAGDHLLRNKLTGVAYYTKAPTIPQNGFYAAESYCLFLKIGGKHWRLPTEAEFQQLIRDQRLIDTPDGRFWPGFNHSTEQLTSVYPTSSEQVNEVFSGIRTVTLYPSGYLKIDTIGLRNGFLNVSDLFETRALCAADWK